MKTLIKKAKDNGIVQITAMALSAAVAVAGWGYIELYTNVTDDVRQTKKEMADIKPDVAATKATINSIDSRLTRIENKIDSLR